MTAFVTVTSAENGANVEPNDTKPEIDCKPPSVVTISVTETDCKMSYTIDVTTLTAHLQSNRTPNMWQRVSK